MVTFITSDGSDGTPANMLTCSPSSAVICAENIALLYALHPVPVPPSSNEINEPSIRQGSYSLSFARERALASILAFLSNTEDNTNHVPALCIEENPELASLNVMLAVNRTKWEDGHRVLQNTKQCLEKIFAVLSDISEERGSGGATEHQVFTTIVSMCYQRILSRLRFVAKKWGTPKQPLRVVLGEAINSLKQVNHQILRSQPVSLFTERAKDVLRLADSWTKHQKLAELEDLVEGVYRLKQIGDIQALLDSIPNRAMSPSSRQNLVNIISKVSRYREAARVLCRTAKRFPSLRRAKVVPVNLPEEAFNRVSVGNYTPQLAPTMARIKTVYQGPGFLSVCRLLNTSGPQLNDQFAAQTRKTLREAKIHAEVQLVVYYELNAPRLVPRVVCSSKDACFLCNAFILMHGKMHTPRCHGRLYCGWRLPSMSNPNDLDLRFNAALEDHIKNSLKLLLSRQKKTVYPDPNESTLLTLPLSTSTLRTSTSVEANKWKEASAKNSSANDTARLQEHSVPSKERESVSRIEGIDSVLSLLCSRSAITAEEDRIPEMSSSDRPMMQVSTRCSHRKTRNKFTPSDIAELIQGVPQMNSIVVARTPQFHIAGTVEIHIEHNTTITVPGADRKDPEIVYSIEWLSVEKARALIEDKAATVIDVEALQCQTSYTLDTQNSLVVMAQGDVIRITPQ